MKKLFTLAIMALVGVTSANAQAFKLENNYVLTTCTLLPDGTVVNSDLGTTGKEITAEMVAKIATAYIDAEYNTLPVSGGTAEGANYHVLKSDYTDPETGVTFKAGTYACLNSYEEIKFKDSFNPQGLKNIKQVVFYLASQGQLQVYARQYSGTDVDNNYNHFEGNPTNRKLKSYKAPGFQTETWTEMYFTKPLKLVVDLTNKQGTEDEMNNASLDVNKNSDDTEVVNSYLQFYDKATDADGKVVQGANLIPWTAESMFVPAFKKKAYVMAIALICGTDGATSKYLDIASENPQWTDGHSVTTGINGVFSTNSSDKTVKAIYAIDGSQVNSLQKGLNIIKYSDGTAKKVIK